MFRLYFILYIFISFDAFSQVKATELNSNNFLFTYKDTSFLISGDSIYRDLDNGKQVGIKHNLEFNDYVFFEDNSKGYLMHNSGGIIYQFDGIKFDRLDDSFIFNSQYESFPFIYNGIIHNFGGYGLFTFKNIITYFNLSKRESEIVSVKTVASKHPRGRKKMFSQLNNDHLFIGAGLGYNVDSEYGYKKSEFINDYWKFDLINKEWQKLGEGNSYLKNEMYHLTYHYNNKTLVLSDDNIFTIDIKNNNVSHYMNSNLDFIKSIKKERGRYLVTYNKSKNGFYAILNKKDAKTKVTFISSEDLLGISNTFEKIYKEKESSLVGIGIIILLILLILTFNKRTNIRKIILKKKKIEDLLTNEEKQILDLIKSNYPNYIKFPDLMDVFDSSLSYESKKKRLRSALYKLEEKITKTLKLRSKIFIERKNKEDLRIKEIRIK